MILLPHHQSNDYKFQCLHLFSEKLALFFELLYHHRSHIVLKTFQEIERRKRGVYSSPIKLKLIFKEEKVVFTLTA